MVAGKETNNATAADTRQPVTAQSIDDSRYSDRELLGVMAERLSGMRESFDEFRRETRENFAASKDAVAELKNELKADGLAIRGEMRETFDKHDKRIRTLEDTNTSGKGMFLGAKWLIGLLSTGPAAAIVAYLFGKNG